MTTARLVQTYLGFQADRATKAGAAINTRFLAIGEGKLIRPIVPDDQFGLAGETSRDPRDGRRGLPQGALARTVPLNLLELPYWLSAAMTRGAPTGTGPYVHGFVSGGAPTKFLTLWDRYSSGKVECSTGVLVSQLRIRFSKSANVARADLTLMPAVQEAIADSLPAFAGTATTHEAVDISDFRFATTWGGTAAVEVTALDLQVNFGIEDVQGMNGSEWPTQPHYGDLDISGSMEIYGDAEAFRADAAAQTRRALNISGTSDQVAGNSILFAMPRVQVSEPGRAVSGGGATSATVQFRGSRGGVSPVPAFAATITNSLAAYPA
jgi:hypothetical protein